MWGFFYVPEERIELSTQGFSVLCSTTELLRHVHRSIEINNGLLDHGTLHTYKISRHSTIHFYCAR